MDKRYLYKNSDNRVVQTQLIGSTKIEDVIGKDTVYKEVDFSEIQKIYWFRVFYKTHFHFPKPVNCFSYFTLFCSERTQIRLLLQQRIYQLKLSRLFYGLPEI